MKHYIETVDEKRARLKSMASFITGAICGNGKSYSNLSKDKEIAFDKDQVTCPECLKLLDKLV